MRYTFDSHTITSALTGLLLLVAGVWAVAPATASAQSAAPDTKQEIRTMLEQRDQQIKSILKGSDDYTAEQRKELQTLINGVIDFRAMGQAALGPFWGDLSEAQRDEFVTVFRDVVRAQSLSDLEVYNSAVTFDEVTVEDDSAFVRTTTQYQGTDTPVEYVLKRSDGEWLAEDIIVDGVSTAEGYARSFQTVVRKRGFDALMTSLKKKRDQVQSTS
jgi:phospholipid transport system substrate-binding protein